MKAEYIYVLDGLSRYAEVHRVEEYRQQIKVEASPEFEEVVRHLAAEQNRTITEVIAIALDLLKRVQNAEKMGYRTVIVDDRDEIIFTLDCD